MAVVSGAGVVSKLPLLPSLLNQYWLSGMLC